LRDRWRALEIEQLSLWDICECNLEGGGPLLETLKDMLRKALETGISLHLSSVGEPEGGSFTGDFERRTKVGSREM
jgi:hypothetical protein